MNDDQVERPKRQRGPLAFKGTDLKRAIITAKEAGLEISRFEINRAGGIIVHIAKPGNDNDDENPGQGSGL